MPKATDIVDFRLACLEDIPALAELIPASARSLQASYYTPAQIEGALGTVFGVDSQLIEDGTYFIAQSGDQIVGCGGWSKRKTLYGCDSRTVREASASAERLRQRGKNIEEDRLLDPSVDAAKIRAFFVHPAWARRGIGSEIMRRCEMAALADGFTTIEIVATLAGEPLYQSFGYHLIDRFEIALPNNSLLPVIRMFKNFTETH
jgi:GNAT superfamily N-acetyltransferase